MPNPFDNPLLFEPSPLNHWQPFGPAAQIASPLEIAGMAMLRDRMRQALGMTDYVNPQGPFNDQPTEAQQARNAKKDRRNNSFTKGVGKQIESGMEKRLNGTQWGPAQPFPEPKPQDISYDLSAKSKPDYASRIRTMESGSPKGDYNSIGPTVTYENGQTDHAYGAYGVMGVNIPSWTEQYYGKRLSPQEFLQNRAAQDAVYKGKFEGEYLPKYGPEGAAKAWFAGEKGMNDNNRTDTLGTSTAEYGKKFINIAEKATKLSPALDNLIKSDPQLFHSVIKAKGTSLSDLLSGKGGGPGTLRGIISGKSGGSGTLTGFLKELRDSKLAQIASALTGLVE